jgi:exonuclease III
MSNLKIFSYNCRGLNDSIKRRDVFNLFHTKYADILCLQETHFIKEFEKKIYSEWNGLCYFSHCKSNAKGVAILCRKDLDIKINFVKTDDSGSFIMLGISLDSINFTLVNIYAPNTDSPSFFRNIFDILNCSDENDSLIICGDYNLVQNPDLDYYNYKSKNNNVKARNFLLSIIEDKELIDPFRELHGDIKNIHGDAPTQYSNVD